MEEQLVKIKIPLPPNDPSGGEAEWVWANPEGDGTFALRNVPTFAKGLSYGDSVRARIEDGIPVFERVVRHSGHSTYRIYAKTSCESAEVLNVLKTLQDMHCHIEPATNRIVNVDVLPEADIYAVYKVMNDAERASILEFEEGHCGHQLRPHSKPQVIREASGAPSSDEQLLG
jgi:hypothetical protein